MVNEFMASPTCRPLDSASLASAVARLRAGGLGIIPTDTVYGIAADVRHDGAVRKIHVGKARPAQEPLQLLFSEDATLLSDFAVLSASAARLIAVLGPGPWTIITPATAGWESAALAGGRTVGVRVPASPAVHALVDALGAPLAASSANRHGGVSPATCAAAVEQVGDYCQFALDGGPVLGLDSTVIDCAAPVVRILREGAIDRRTIARILELDQLEVVRSVRL
ncbi:MAG: L-threonylcarbamoyladenylate synthase [Tepidiformaceae bacterium]